MDDLIAWIRTQLDEVERITSAASEVNPSPWSLLPGYDGGTFGREGVVLDANGCGLWENEGYPKLYPALEATARHMATNDPASVLATVEADRATIAHHAPVPAKKHPGYDCQWCKFPYPCFDAQNLATKFADHPGFREHWRTRP